MHLRTRVIALTFALAPGLSQADGCARDRALDDGEKNFVRTRTAAAQAAFPAAPAGWVRYQPGPGLESRIRGGFQAESICEDFEPRPLRWTTHATYTPKDSALMQDLERQRLEAQRKQRTEALQAKITAAGQRGDFDAMTRYSQELQAASAPIGSRSVTPLPDEAFEKRVQELERRMEQATQRNDIAAIQAISAEQTRLLMRQSGVDDGDAGAAAPNPDEAPRVHVVVEFNAGNYQAPENARRISPGGAQGFLSRHGDWCFADGGPAQKAQADVLLGAWQGDGRTFHAPAAQNGSRTRVVTRLVTVCGDPPTVDKILSTIPFDKL
jgi:hypothetical protein